jgi:hypothetical protein
MQVKLSLGILAVMGALVSTVAVPSASAQTHGTLKHAPEWLETIPTTSCGFEIDVFQLVGPQRKRESREQNGERAVTSSGRLVLKFENKANPKKTAVEDVSGTVKRVYHEGSIEEIGDGRNWWALGTDGKKNTGRPGLFITSGPVDLHVVPPTVLSLTTLGTYQRDLCKALASKS